jgi:uncharacterized protein
MAAQYRRRSRTINNIDATIAPMEAPATLFVIEHAPGPTWEDGTTFREQPGIEDHFAFMSSLHERGVLVIGGPFMDDVGGRPVGMAVVRVASADEADALAAQDEAVVKGLLTYRVRPWRVPMGIALSALGDSD